MSLLSSCTRMVRNILDPVCQDKGAPLYGYHRNYLVRLAPVLDPNDATRVVRWIPDPNEAAEIDRIITEGKAGPTAPTAQAVVVPPVLTPASAPTAPAPAVNPAAVPGL